MSNIPTSDGLPLCFSFHSLVLPGHRSGVYYPKFGIPDCQTELLSRFFVLLLCLPSIPRPDPPIPPAISSPLVKFVVSHHLRYPVCVCFLFLRPYYLMNLLDEPFDEDGTLGLLVRETIGGEYYVGPENYLVNMTVDEVQQWNLQGSEQHPFHMHVNHVQFINVDGPALVPGWNQVGDWVDTVSSELTHTFGLQHR